MSLSADQIRFLLFLDKGVNIIPVNQYTPFRGESQLFFYQRFGLIQESDRKSNGLAFGFLDEMSNQVAKHKADFGDSE